MGCIAVSSGPGRGKNQAETVGIAKPKDPPIALVFAVEREAEDVTIPGKAASNVGDGEGSTEVLGDEGRCGGPTGRWIVGHM